MCRGSLCAARYGFQVTIQPSCFELSVWSLTLGSKPETCRYTAPVLLSTFSHGRCGADSTISGLVKVLPPSRDTAITFLNPLTPTGTLDFNYLKPFVSLSYDIRKDLSYKTAWNYFGYDDHGVANPVGLALLPSQNFNGSNVTFSLKYVY